MKRTFTMETRVVAARNQVSSDLGGEVAILHLERGTYYGLDGVGARVWGLIQEPTTVRAVHDVVLNEYEVDPAKCERDVISLLSDLANKELVEVEDGNLA